MFCSFMLARDRNDGTLLEMQLENEKKLLESTEKGDANELEAVLKEGVLLNTARYGSSLLFRSRKYLTPLHIAAEKGKKDIMEILIKNRANVNACDVYDVTPIHLAAQAGHADIVQLLIDNDANVDQRTLLKLPQWGITKDYPHPGGTTALHLASKNNHIKCIHLLIDAGADYNAADEDGRTSLYMAAERGFESAMLAHLHSVYGKPILSIPVKDTNDTPLHQCVQRSMLTAVTELLAHGADVNLLNKAGYSPLHLALQNLSQTSSVDIIKTLVKNGYRADVNLKDAHGISPLEYVCFIGSKFGRHPDLTVLLITYGAKFLHLKFRNRMTLIEQELQKSVNDYTILQAVVKALDCLPPLSRYGFHEADVKLMNQVPGSEQSDFIQKYEWYGQIAASVRSLQHHCRSTIRNQMGPHRLNVIHTLPIPEAVQNYLLFGCSEYK